MIHGYSGQLGSVEYSTGIFPGSSAASHGFSGQLGTVDFQPAGFPGGVRGAVYGQQIAQIFADGTPGAWWDPGDMSTLFQDMGASTAVTGPNQPIGLVIDKSGRGNNIFQPTLSAEPAYTQDAGGKYFVSFDGGTNCLYSAAAAFATGGQMFAAFAFKSQSAASGAAMELTASPDNTPGSFNMYLVNGTGITANIRGAATQNDGVFNTAAIGTPVIISAAWDQNAPTHATQKIVNVNGQPATDTPTSVSNGGNFVNAPIYIGRRGNTNNQVNVGFYGAIIVGRLVTPTERSAIESYLNTRTGAY